MLSAVASSRHRSSFGAVRSGSGVDALDVSDAARLGYGHNRLSGGRRVGGVVSQAPTEDVTAVVRLACSTSGSPDGSLLGDALTVHAARVGDPSIRLRVPEARGLAEIVELVRRLRMNDVVPRRGMQRIPEFRRPTAGIKPALDPKRSIAPGKYGIA
jgi:hypothetical protein